MVTNTLTHTRRKRGQVRLGEDDERALLALTTRYEPIPAIASRIDHGPGYTMALIHELRRHGFAVIGGPPGNRLAAITLAGQQRKEHLISDVLDHDFDRLGAVMEGRRRLYA